MMDTTMHLHAYALANAAENTLKVQLKSRHSTDAAGVASALGRRENSRIELTEILEILQNQISVGTLFNTDHFTGFTPATKPA